MSTHGYQIEMNSSNHPELKLLTLAQAYPCSYLDNKLSNSIFIDSKTPPSWLQYCQLTKIGFRRSGQHFYRPECPTCDACKSSRIRVNDINLNNKRLKRIINKATGFSYGLIKPTYNDEHYLLYEKYINARHADGDMFPPTEDQYEKFLIGTESYNHFFEVRDEHNRLVICTVVDLLDDGISAIYTYFDPERSKYSPGTLAVALICKLAKQYNLPFVYLGYWVKNSKKMNYKAQYKPLEIYNDEIWQELQEEL